MVIGLTVFNWLFLLTLCKFIVLFMKNKYTAYYSKFLAVKFHSRRVIIEPVRQKWNFYCWESEESFQVRANFQSLRRINNFTLRQQRLKINVSLVLLYPILMKLNSFDEFSHKTNDRKKYRSASRSEILIIKSSWSFRKFASWNEIYFAGATITFLRVNFTSKNLEYSFYFLCLFFLETRIFCAIITILNFHNLKKKRISIKKNKKVINFIKKVLIKCY